MLLIWLTLLLEAESFIDFGCKSHSWGFLHIKNNNVTLSCWEGHRLWIWAKDLFYLGLPSKIFIQELIRFTSLQNKHIFTPSPGLVPEAPIYVVWVCLGSIYTSIVSTCKLSQESKSHEGGLDKNQKNAPENVSEFTFSALLYSCQESVIWRQVTDFCYRKHLLLLETPLM